MINRCFARRASRRDAAHGVAAVIGAFFLVISSVAYSATTTVSVFAPYSVTPTEGVWYEMQVEAGGAADIVNLSGVGGNLENNQPLPVGAGLLTTGSSNPDVAHVGVVDSYGNASDILTDG